MKVKKAVSGGGPGKGRGEGVHVNSVENSKSGALMKCSVLPPNDLYANPAHVSGWASHMICSEEEGMLVRQANPSLLI